MKKHEIQVGTNYIARVSGKFVTVRVDAIRETDSRFSYGNRSETRFYVTNLATGRKLVFRSAQKFRGIARPFVPTAKIPVKTPTTPPDSMIADTAAEATHGDSEQRTMLAILNDVKENPLVQDFPPSDEIREGLDDEIRQNERKFGVA